MIRNNLIWVILVGLLITSCISNSQKKDTIERDENGYVLLTDEQVENIVKRAYQYVALYNVNNKFAATQGGWNTLSADTELKDHNMRDIARPNNDSFYTGIMLDLRKDAYVVNLPKFDSKYVSLMVTAYDHYVHVPKSTRKGDFQKAERILFYGRRTEHYKGKPIEGIDNIFEANGDFISVIFRVMPHANEPERFSKVVEQINRIGMESLSEYLGQDPILSDAITFPEVGKTDFDIFENNFLEVMQFVFNHLTFDESVEMDNKLLACFEPLGIVPGNTYNPEKAVKIEGKRFRKTAEKIHKENLSLLSDPDMATNLGPRIFKPKGETDLEAILAVSVIGPIGLPLEEAFYPSVNTADGSQMNASRNYVIKMTKDELPPAKAFWSFTLYDKTNGFFIPNDYKKYSIGENAGMKLNKDGGIEIYIAAEKPEGVPFENWLPTNGGDEDLDIILRIYVPELDKLPGWRLPLAEVIE
ncbi:MAG: DUF1214 domain-containing protein [Cytophagales bacterium]|nr:DUF1214 domain-containing protein [Cytophagales bacterium]